LLISVIAVLLTSLFELQSMPNLWVKVTLVGVWLGLVLVGAEGLYKITNAESEIVRKIVHIGTGNVIILAWWLQIPAWVGIAASIGAAAIALLSYSLPLFPGINSVGRKSLGTFFYAVSIGVLIAWFWPLEKPYYAAIGILVMALGDGLAALIGRKFGKHRYQIWGEKKSVEGSLTMAVISYAVTGVILLGVLGNSEQIWFSAIAVAVVATVLEAISKIGIDNLTVPIGSAAVCFFLNQI
jgi:phytol kinase